MRALAGRCIPPLIVELILPQRLLQKAVQAFRSGSAIREPLDHPETPLDFVPNVYRPYDPGLPRLLVPQWKVTWTS